MRVSRRTCANGRTDGRSQWHVGSVVIVVGYSLGIGCGRQIVKSNENHSGENRTRNKFFFRVKADRIYVARRSVWFFGFTLKRAGKKSIDFRKNTFSYKTRFINDIRFEQTLVGNRFCFYSFVRTCNFCIDSKALIYLIKKNLFKKNFIKIKRNFFN